MNETKPGRMVRKVEGERGGLGVGMIVSLRDCAYPDGNDVTGDWEIIGRKGSQVVLERYGTRIAAPVSAVLLKEAA
jgi:hypothetical protein